MVTDSMGMGYTADRLQTRPFLLCGIAVAWLRVVVSLCVWYGMARVNGEEICLPRYAKHVDAFYCVVM